LLCFALLSFPFLPLRLHFPSPRQASKQASRAYAMQTYTYAPISPRISTMISPWLLAVGLQQKDFLAFVCGDDDDDDDDKRKDEREREKQIWSRKTQHTNATPSLQHRLAWASPSFGWNPDRIQAVFVCVCVCVCLCWLLTSIQNLHTQTSIRSGRSRLRPKLR
jgi:hypothetical protein